ncbi:MAG TPA: 3-carboxy-cis,cis-muconate cycloisomerase [Caldimonas sp.]|jgi:3-carboxy-cis,cis-muconate cycloisomerase|nr:3-carboxy-cis,cis-muconate cycloisomerase [Caldimonas sp.]HEX2542773.1 3-carboxy-cis,cis-muconate cycloisomerase [Caldimonas sp.]
MSGSLFARTLGSAAMGEVFGDRALVAGMLSFEAALAEAEADEGVIPRQAVAAIVAACSAAFDVDELVHEARVAGSLAIPLVRRLTARVAEVDAQAAGYVHWGSTSQDVIDTAMVLATRRALELVDADLDRLCAALAALARAHLETPMLARTLLQPAQVISVGFKLVAWVAPLSRARDRLARARRRALTLQFGGAVGTLASLAEKGPAVARRIADRLGLAPAAGAWHTQRDAWVALACDVAVLCGSLGKIGHDLALLAQAEVGEMAEPAGIGRGGSSAMPNKRNPVAAMTAIAAAARTPHHAGALLAAMGQEHERSLGRWQAELAEWPSLFIATHGALAALADAAEGLEVDSVRMRANIDAQRGAVFAEAAATVLARSIGKSRAHALVAAWSKTLAGSADADLAALARAALREDAALATVDAAALDAAFDIDAAARRAGSLARAQLDALQRAPSSAGDPS